MKAKLIIAATVMLALGSIPALGQDAAADLGMTSVNATSTRPALALHAPLRPSNEAMPCLT